jgi:S1-C subfamily serine protease
MKTKYLLAALVVAVAALTGVVSAQLVGPGTAGSARGQAAPAATTTTSRPDGERAAKRTARPDPADQKLSQADLIAKVKPSVVPLAGSNGSGSGVVIDARRGLVLTNAHVTFGQQGMRARVGDDPGTETAARLVAAAPCDDLAVVRLVDTPANLRAIRLGDSSTLRQGDHVTVLGYPVSFEEQAEASILDRQVVAGEGSVSVADVVAAPDPACPGICRPSSTRRP